MGANSIINLNTEQMFYVTPEGITIQGRTRVYETYQKMIEDKNPSKFAWVLDATGDETVDEGAAFYVYKGGTWQKLYESEAMENSNKPDGYDEFVQGFEDHINNSTIHVTEEDKNSWDNKVDSVPGKSLSSNDYTDEDKTLLHSFKEYDDSALAVRVSNLESNKYDVSAALELQNRIGMAESGISSLEANKADKSDLTTLEQRIAAVEQELLGVSDVITEIKGLI